MTVTATHTVRTDHAARRRLGWTFVAAGLSWIGYLVLALTVSADYETALEDASDALDTPVNKLPADVLAQIGQDHPGNIASGVLLFFVPALLLLAARGTRTVTGDPWAERLAWLSAGVLWFYFVLTLGLFTDPDDLPPLTRDLDVLTVPLVSAGSVLALLAFVAAAWSLRRHGWRRVASAVAAGLAGALLVAGVVGSIVSGWDEPVAPVGLLPTELILGIALVVGTRPRSEATS